MNHTVRNRIHILTSTLLFMLIIASCDRTPIIEPAQPTKAEQLSTEGANRVIAKAEETQIDSYLARRQWQARNIADGVRIATIRQGSNNAIAADDTIDITYTIEAITGTTIYENCHDTVIVGRHQPNQGLDAALLTMHYGDSAHVIVPSHMGYGVAGDGARIPTRTILIYHIGVKTKPITYRK